MEKMKILQMLEEGKINAEEAARLLQSVDAPKKHTTYAHAPSPEDRPVSGNQAAPPPTPPIDMAGELGRKIETFARDMEPKITRLTEAMVEKTANMADKLSKSFAEASKPLPPRPEYHAPRPAEKPAEYHAPRREAPAPSPGALTERSFEMLVSSGYNELSLAAFNGDILIKGYNGDKITARVSWRAKHAGAPIDLVRLGNKYYLNYDEDDFDRVYVDAYVPESMFDRVRLTTVNGRLDISTLKCEYFNAANSNGEARIGDLNAGDIKIECDNSVITLANVNGKNAHIENFNGAIQADSLDVSQMRLSTFNAHIALNIAALEKYANYSWTVETNNGKLSMNMPSHPSLGYDLKVRNSLGSIKIGLTGLSYSVNSPTIVEARSIDYLSATRKVEISAETSNAPLVVN